MNYPDVNVLTMHVSREVYGSDLLGKLSGVNGVVGIKGGFAREMLKVALKIADTHLVDKISDLDLVVFEEPQPTREERIARRDYYASTIENVDPKDLEFLDSGERGLVHYFLTRDVTMNEVIVFCDEDSFRILYTPICAVDLQDRVIRPSVHCAHSGLDSVWVKHNGKVVIHPNIVRRCIYRRIKGDGERYDFDLLSMADSRELFSVDLLFKLSKRFMDDARLFQKCCDVLVEFGFDPQSVQEVIALSAMQKKKPKVDLTSSRIEDMLEAMKESYDQWSAAHSDSSYRTKAKVVFI
jgi:hypothetical protein